MPFRIKVSLVIIALLLALFLVVPLIVPISAPPGVKPLAAVAGPSADYLTVKGVDLYLERQPYQPTGDPGATTGQPPATFVLLHDYAFNSYTYAKFAPLLAQHGAVVAYDRPGFGLSERPMPPDYANGFNPYTPQAQVDLLVALLDSLGVQRAVLVANGLGANVALNTAQEHPERVEALVLLAAAGQTSGGRSAPAWLLASPQMRRLGPVFLRQLAGAPGEQLFENAWADPEAITPEDRAAHQRTTSVEDWDRAMWEISLAANAGKAVDLASVTAPTLVVAGEDDNTLPVSEPERLANELPDAQLAVMPACGHLPQLECPEELDALLSDWLASTVVPAP